MLGNMADPKAIGPAMAVALLTTLYGAFIANIMFAPMVTKLEGYTAYETTIARWLSRAFVTSPAVSRRATFRINFSPTFRPKCRRS